MTTFTRQNPSPRYASMIDLCRRLHAEGDQLNALTPTDTFDGRSLVQFVQPIAGLTRQFKARSVLDYGCGKAVAHASARVTLADGRNLVGLKSIWDVEQIALYDPAYPPYSTFPRGLNDGVISTDVLEHCPEEDVPWVIDEIFGFARLFVFVSIASYAAKNLLPTGENAHVTLKSPG